MEQERDTELAWVAGYLSSRGSFTIAPGGKVRLIVKTQGSPEALQRVKQGLHLRGEVNECRINGSSGWRISCSGEPLQAALRLIWDLLTKERRAQYARIKREAAKRSSHP